MKLHQAFGVTPGDVVAFVGAGGKTSTIINLGHELAELGWRVLATTTTTISEDQLHLLPNAVSPEVGSDAISDLLNTHGFVFLYDRIRHGEVYGPDPSWIPRLIDAVDSDIMLIEADAADGLPLKAPLEEEPNIPPETSLVVAVLSLTALGQPLDSDHVYNPRAIIERYGFPEGQRIKSPWLAQILRDETLGMRGIPPKARSLAFLNQVSRIGYVRARARLIARLALRTGQMQGVVIGAARSDPPVYEVIRQVGAVVLAAGMSTRMGEPKVLLPWGKGHSIISHIVEQLNLARLDQISVVTGHHAADVKRAVTALGADTVFNRSYKVGEMLSSLKVGLRSLNDQVSAALIVLGDQPRLQAKVIYQLLLAYAEGQGEIIVPSYQNRRGHPILVSRRYWGEILSLPRGGSLRDVLTHHTGRIYHVQVDTDSVLRDVDTPEDYANERWRAGFN